MTRRDFDLVLYGASGFVGRLTAAHLAAHVPATVRVALAGRSLPRLQQVRDGLGAAASGWELVKVDATDAVGLRALASRARVLATTVGPYVLHGREVARACAEEGTHYADLTGELLFVRWSLDELNARARETGARLVHSCGFDSVPSDLGVWLTARHAAADGAGRLTDSTLVVRRLKGALSGGTLASMRQQAVTWGSDADARRVLTDPYGLSPRRDVEPSTSAYGRSAHRGWSPVEREAGTGHWLGPFVMASYNTRVVRLSNALSNYSYGRDFRYREVSDVGAGAAGFVRALGLVAGLGLMFGGLAWSPTRRVVDRFLPQPGDGPDADARAAGRFRLEIMADTESGVRYRTIVSTDRDPGYDATAIMLGQSALSLALDDLPEAAGVLTPAVALGDALVRRLRQRDFTLETARPAV